MNQRRSQWLHQTIINKEMKRMEPLIRKFPELHCSPLQFCILELLRAEKVSEWTQQEMADFFGVTRETISKNIKLLEERGMIRRVNVGKRSVYFYSLCERENP
jgi:DNA-binding MarR family transcriptional regulator